MYQLFKELWTPWYGETKSKCRLAWAQEVIYFWQENHEQLSTSGWADKKGESQILGRFITAWASLVHSNVDKTACSTCLFEACSLAKLKKEKWVPLYGVRWGPALRNNFLRWRNLSTTAVLFADKVAEFKHELKDFHQAQYWDSDPETKHSSNIWRKLYRLKTDEGKIAPWNWSQKFLAGRFAAVNTHSCTVDDRNVREPEEITFVGAKIA